MTGDELIPFVLTLPHGVTSDPTPGQRALEDLLDDRPRAIDRAELELGARRTARRQAAARALALAALEGIEGIHIAAATEGAARELYELAVAELELAGRTLGVDVGPARERLRASVGPR